MSVNFRDGDLIVLDKRYGKAHIFWTDSKYGLRICRPSMVRKGKDERWTTLKQDVNPKNFKKEVEKHKRPICKECLKMCTDPR